MQDDCIGALVSPVQLGRLVIIRSIYVPGSSHFRTVGRLLDRSIYLSGRPASQPSSPPASQPVSQLACRPSCASARRRVRGRASLLMCLRGHCGARSSGGAVAVFISRPHGRLASGRLERWRPRGRRAGCNWAEQSRLAQSMGAPPVHWRVHRSARPQARGERISSRWPTLSAVCNSKSGRRVHRGRRGSVGADNCARPSANKRSPGRMCNMFYIRNQSTRRPQDDLLRARAEPAPPVGARAASGRPR